MHSEQVSWTMNLCRIAASSAVALVGIVVSVASLAQAASMDPEPASAAAFSFDPNATIVSLFGDGVVLQPVGSAAEFAQLAWLPPLVVPANGTLSFRESLGIELVNDTAEPVVLPRPLPFGAPMPLPPGIRVVFIVRSPVLGTPPVPEPGSVLLLALGAGVTVLTIRKRVR